MAALIDPAVRAPHHGGARLEAAKGLDRVHLLYAEGFAMADQRRCILSVVHVFRQYRHVACAHRHGTAQRGIAAPEVMKSARQAIRSPSPPASGPKSAPGGSTGPLFAVFFIFIADFQVAFVTRQAISPARTASVTAQPGSWVWVQL